MADSDREIWFPAKRYGWGWGLPCAWQGWVVMATYVVMLLIGAFAIDRALQPDLFIGWVIGWTLLLVGICWAKGERPRWRWGRRG
jgi:hypothetical protein